MSRRLDKNLLIEVGACGDVSPSQLAAQRLANARGVWRLVPDVGRLMVLELMVDNRSQARTAQAPREVRLAGTFDDVNVLATVLNLIHMAKWDGALHVSGDRAHTILYFRQGAFLGAKSSSSHHRLGQVMVRNQLLTESQRQACSEDMNASSRFGTLLVSKALMTTQGVYEGLRLQAEEIFNSVLQLETGSFYLVQPLDMTEVPAMLRLDLQQLLLDCMRRLDETRGRATPAANNGTPERKQSAATDALPHDGAATIAAVYSEALRQLFGSVAPAARSALVEELEDYIEDAGAQDPLLRGVGLNPDGSLSVQLLENLSELADPEPAAQLQLTLNELLFFVMFAAGDALEPELKQTLRHTVENTLQDLPAVG